MRVVAFGIVAILTFDVFAGKPAWKLTPEERAALRADALGRAERHRLWALDGRYPVDAQNDVVDGARTPEIIAPIELMDLLLSTYSLLEKDRTIREQFRRDWQVRRAAEHLGPKFWEDLKTLLASMIAVHEKTRKEPGSAGRDCAATAEALTLARTRYGHEKFDRFLYEVVAPGANWSTSTSSPELFRQPQHWLDEWKWKEDGCR